VRELPRLDVTASEAFISSFVHLSTGKMRKMSKRIEKSQKSQNLHFPPNMRHFVILHFCSAIYLHDFAVSIATFFRSLDRTIYLIIIQLRIVRILTAFLTRCLCSATLDFQRE
jgi:hypothetical protein